MVKTVGDGEQTRSDAQLDEELRKFAQHSLNHSAALGEHEAPRRRVAALLFGEDPDQTHEDDLDQRDEAKVEISQESLKIRRIHRYEVRAMIGSGAMGRVFEAYDPQLARPLAIKVLHPGYSEKAKARARIVREARALARLSHPNVIQVYDVGDSEVGFFIAMEWVLGKTLRVFVQDTPPQEWRGIMAQFLDAGEGLAAAHEAGLVHRDFKPENVIVGEDGRVRVLDFGLARPAGPGSLAVVDADQEAGDDDQRKRKLTGLTQTGAMIGTPIYMAPELYKGGVANAASDQFAYCVALFDAMYKQRPFAGTTVESYAKSVVAGTFAQPPAEVAQRYPEGLLEVIARGLALEPSDRYPTMDALLAALREVTFLPAAPMRRKRRNVAVLLGACLLTAVIVSQLRIGAFWPGGQAGSGTEGTDTRSARALVAKAESTQPAPGPDNTLASLPQQAQPEPPPPVSVPPKTTKDPEPDPPKPAPAKPPKKTRPSGKKKRTPRRADWCSLHEDTYRLLKRGRRRVANFRAKGQCFSCRIEARASRTQQFSPRDCTGYQLCGPASPSACDP